MIHILISGKYTKLYIKQQNSATNIIIIKTHKLNLCSLLRHNDNQTIYFIYKKNGYPTEIISLNNQERPIAKQSDSFSFDPQ